MQGVYQSYPSLSDRNRVYTNVGTIEKLVSEYQSTRNERIRVEIIDRYERMTIVIARRFLSMGEPLEDLVQEGNIGLLRAIDHYNPSKGARFSTYAARRISSAVEHYVRDRGRLIRQPAWIQERCNRVRRETERLRAILGRDPLPAEVARQLELGEDQILDAARLIQMSDFDSLDEPIDEDGSSTRGDCVSCSTITMFSADRYELKRASQALSELELAVLYFLYECDLTQKETAESLGLTHSKVRRLMNSALKHLRTQLAA